MFQAANAVLSFILTPYLIRRMGVETYGLYLIFHTAASYMALASLGAGGATYKYVSFYHGTGNSRALKETMTYSLLMHGLGALAAAAILGPGARFFAVRLFHLSGPLLGPGIFVLRLAAAGALFMALMQVALNALPGLQRFDYYNVVLFAQAGLGPLGIAGLLALGVGIRGVLAWYVAFTGVVSLAALWIISMLVARADAGARPSPDPGLPFGVFIKWSLSQLLIPMAWMVTYNSDKIFIARAMSLSSMTLYSVPAGLLQRLQIFPGAVSTVAMPIMSELQGEDAHERLRRMYLKSLRFLLWLMLPTLTLLFVFMPQFLTLWLSGQFSGESTHPARLLVLAQVFLTFTAMPSTVVNTKQNPWYVPALYWGQAITSVVAWKLLIPHYALLGVALGSLLAQALPGSVYLFLIHRRVLALPLRRFVSEGLYAPVASAALLLVATAPIHMLATNWIRLFSLAAFGGLVYYASTWFLLDTEDRELIKKFLRAQTA